MAMLTAGAVRCTRSSRFLQSPFFCDCHEHLKLHQFHKAPLDNAGKPILLLNCNQINC